MEQFLMQDKVIEDIKLNSAIRDRRIFISGDIDSESMFKACYLLDRLVSFDNQCGTKEDIEIIIDSYGGFIHSGLSFVSKLESLKDANYKIITTVNSVAMSMGFVIGIVGSHKRALRHSRIMCHQPSSESWGNLKDMEESVEETQQLWVRMKDIIIRNTKITDEQLEDIKYRKYDWYFWGNEKITKDLGIIDEVI